VAAARSSHTIEEYAEATTEALRTAAAAHGLPLAGVTLEIEPGRAIFADTGIHLARVTRVKRQTVPLAWAWVEVDTADVFLSDVVTEHTRFTAVVADRADAPPVQHADIVGCSCNWDQLIEQEALPEVATGDVIAFLGTGCYEEVSAANFNALPRPATVLVDGAGAAVVRRAETLADVLSRDL
jgi:diaminopimelate decarboxylase